MASVRSTGERAGAPGRAGSARVPSTRPPLWSGSIMLGAEAVPQMGGHPRIGGRVVHEHRLPGEELLDHRAVGRDGGADEPAGVVERRHGDDLQAALLGRAAARPPAEASASMRACSATTISASSAALAGEQRGGHGHGAVDPALPLPGRLVQPGVADRDAGLGGQHPHHVQVSSVNAPPRFSVR